jgi:hypothetical protein
MRSVVDQERVESTAPELLLAPTSSFVENSIDYGKRGTYTSYALSGYMVWETNSIKNERLAITRRLLQQPTFNFRPNTLDGAVRYFRNRAKPLEPMERESVINGYGGAKKQRYQRAADSLDHEELTRADFKISSFVKAERVLDIEKYPRMVHFRNYRQILELLRYIKPIEHTLYKKRLVVPRTELRSTGRCVAKGLNGNERYELIKSKFDSFENPVCLSLDCSSFELHVARGYLIEEFRILRSYYKGDKYLEWILSNMLDNKGMTKMGQRWRRRGGRVSGDALTGLGNTLAMLVIMVQYAKDNPNIEFDILSDGDDTLFFCNERDLDEESIQNAFREAGHLLRVDGKANCLGDIIFCQHKPLDGSMVRSPMEIIEKCLVVPRKVNDYYDHVAGVAKGLRAVYGNIPELRHTLDLVIKLSPTAKISDEYWLRFPQTGLIEVGRIWDAFPGGGLEGINIVLNNMYVEKQANA